VRYATKDPLVEYGPLGLNVLGSLIDASLSELAGATRPIISLAMGSPAPDAIPFDTLAAIAGEVLTESGAVEAFGYMPTEGDPRLRRALLAHLAARGLEVDPSCLIVTTGGMQGLDLVCRLFLGPGDIVLAESPSYPNGLATIHNQGARTIQIPLDADGMDLAAAREAVPASAHRPTLIYAIPSFQNPSGVTYSLDRRLALLDFAQSIGAIVVEDDPYSDLRFEGERLPSLLELDGGNGRVIQVSTFSKIIAPGLRLGWVVGPRRAIERMTALRQSMDTCANALAQRIVARFIESGALDRHIANLRSLYPRRRDALVSALHASLGSDKGFRWTLPMGGMFVWVQLPDEHDGAALAQAAFREGVAIVPGSAFDGDRCSRAIRLCFAAVDEESAREAVTRLARAVDRCSRAVA
jgi:2-aminoadipate transaminase